LSAEAQAYRQSYINLIQETLTYLQSYTPPAETKDKPPIEVPSDQRQELIDQKFRDKFEEIKSQEIDLIEKSFLSDDMKEAYLRLLNKNIYKLGIK